jgi:uncharacterized membrane protein YedE/YeeE
MLSRLRSAGTVAACAGLFAGAWLAFYLWVLWQEGEGDLREANVHYVVASVGAAATVLALTGWLRSPSVRAGALAASAAALSGFALLAATTIGVLLLPAVALAWLAVSKEHEPTHERPHPQAAAAGVAIGIAIVIAFLLTLL